MNVDTAAGFELLPHTAEMGVRAWGPNLPQAFAQAARGMFAVMIDVDTVRDRELRRVEVSGEDAEELLVRWLNELVYLVDTERLVFGRFEIERFDRWSLSAIAHGEPLDPARHAPRAEVKSATYHRIGVEEGPPASVRVYVDI